MLVLFNALEFLSLQRNFEWLTFVRFQRCQYNLVYLHYLLKSAIIWNNSLIIIQIQLFLIIPDSSKLKDHLYNKSGSWCRGGLLWNMSCLCVWRILLNTDTVLVTWALYMKITLQINQTWIEVFKGVLSAKHFMYFFFFLEPGLLRALE